MAPIPGDANMATRGGRVASGDAIPDGDPWCVVDAVLTEAFLARGRNSQELRKHCFRATTGFDTEPVHRAVT